MIMKSKYVVILIADIEQLFEITENMENHRESWHQVEVVASVIFVFP